MNPSSHTLIAQARSLSHAWDGRTLFQNLSFDVPAGVTLLRGDEQTGKTTLLRILAGELKPDTGEVVQMAPTKDQSWAFRPDPLDSEADPTPVADWLAQVAKRFPAFDHSIVPDLAQALDLTPHLHKPLYMLSAGSRRKVGHCAAFASGAALTLLDQPFTALDLSSSRILCTLLQELAEHPRRACVVADYAAPEGVMLSAVIDL